MSDGLLMKDFIYKRKNGENIVNDPAAIESCKNEQNRDVIDNARLGSYDKFGNYIIIPDIKNELIALPKLIYHTKQQKNGESFEMKASIPIFGDIFFKLNINSQEASLFLVETVKREAGGYLEIYEEPVDSLSLAKEKPPLSVIFKIYNITEKADDFGKVGLGIDFNNLLTRKVYLSLLSKEFKEVSRFDEHSAFDKMVLELKASGAYGKRVLSEFVERLRDRPGVFEISKTENYNKAVNEVLLSSLDVVTTQEDKENPQIKQTYLKVQNARNENIEEFLEIANSKVDEKYVKKVVDKAILGFNMPEEDKIKKDAQEEIDEFFDKLETKPHPKRILDKPILKQGKESIKEEVKEEKEVELRSKEDKIKEILEKKQEIKKAKTPANKKLKAAKSKIKIQKLKARKRQIKKQTKPSPFKRKIVKKVDKKKAKKNLKSSKGKVKTKNKKKIKKSKVSKKVLDKTQTLKSKPKELKKALKKPLLTQKMSLVMRSAAPQSSMDTLSSSATLLRTKIENALVLDNERVFDKNRNENSFPNYKRFYEECNKEILSSTADNADIKIKELELNDKRAASDTAKSNNFPEQTDIFQK